MPSICPLPDVMGLLTTADLAVKHERQLIRGVGVLGVVQALCQLGELRCRTVVELEKKNRLAGHAVRTRGCGRHVCTGKPSWTVIYVLWVVTIAWVRQALALNDLQLGGLADDGLGCLLVLKARKLDDKTVRAQLLNAGLRHAEAVDAAGDDADEAVHLVLRWRGTRGVPGLVDEVDAADKV